MIDAKDLFQNKETVIGYIETSAGGVLLTDGGWEEDVPLTTQESTALDLNIEPSRIPVIAVRKNGKRFLILAIDDATPSTFINSKVDIEDAAELPKEEEDEKKPEEEKKQ